MFATLIHLSYEFDLDNTFNKNVLKYIYDFYKTSDDETIIQRDIFNTLLTLDTEKFYIFKLLSNKALKTALLVDNYISLIPITMIQLSITKEKKKSLLKVRNFIKCSLIQ